MDAHENIVDAVIHRIDNAILTDAIISNLFASISKSYD